MTINWEEQWALYAPGFEKGLAHIPLPNGNSMPLYPGPGFGDLSHPTTKMVLQLLPSYVKDKIVFDIGCGSGILSIAAALMGAKKVYGCDIDPDALEHAARNIALNQVNVQLQNPAIVPNCILMNMIFLEQKAAWSAHQSPFHYLITSGILKEERSEYLLFAENRGWSLHQEQEEAGWLAFIFKRFE